MRKKKKTREHWYLEERIGDLSRVVGLRKTTRGAVWDMKRHLERSAATAPLRLKSESTLHVVHVVRYQRAPLIPLPPWKSVDSGIAVIDATTSLRHAFIKFDGDLDSEDGCNFEAFVYGDESMMGLEILASMIFESSTLSDAKKWVHEHLRKLGYRVAKAKKTDR